MIQSATSAQYNYDVIDLDRAQSNEETSSTQTQVEKVEVQECMPTASAKTMDTAEAIEKSIAETTDYGQKIKEKITSSDISEQEHYMAIALDIKKTIENLIGYITEEDVKNVLKENYNPEKISIDMLVKIIDQNKMAIKVKDYDQIKREAQVQVETFKNLFSDEKTLKKIITSLKEHNLPVNQQNIEKVLQVLNKVDEIKELSNVAIVNVIKQNKELTIENVYKAKFMSAKINVDGPTLEAILPQIKQLLKEEKLPVNKDTLELCKMLIQKDIPLDKETFGKIKILKNDLNKIDLYDVVDKAVENKVAKKVMADISIVPQEQSMSKMPDKHADVSQISRIVDQLPEVQSSHVEHLVRNNRDINLEQLFMVIREEEIKGEATTKASASAPSTTQPLEPSQALKVIKATLNLEEIRLKMTVEAATRLYDKGFNIEVEPLEKVVDGLRGLERETYARHLEQNLVPVTKENLDQVQEVYDQVDQLRQVTSKAVVKVTTQEVDFTIQALSNETRKELLASHAMRNYEQMETKPRKDLGDSIEKAFVHLEDQIRELGIEPVESVVRAAKILARNEVPLSVAQLEAVMLVDQKVVAVTEKLHPNIVVQMIKDQLSPVDLHIDEVLAYMSHFEEKMGTTPGERFEKAIFELDQSKELTPPERESLVGIYRMFSTVSKSKGEVVGFLMKNDLPLKLNNLFEAAKYIKKTKGEYNLIQADIGDEFGLLKEMKYESKSIKQQIETAIEKSTMAPTQDNLKLMQALEKAGIPLDLENLNKAGLSQHIIDVFLDQAAYEPMMALTKEGAFKDSEMSLEKLANQLGSTKESAPEDVKKIIEAIKGLSQIDAKTINNLEKFELSKNLQTLMTAHEAAQKPFELSGQLNKVMKALEEQPMDTSELKRILANSGERLGTFGYEKTLAEIKEELSHYQQELLSAQTRDGGALHKTISETTQLIDYQKAIHKGDEYYQIPMMMHGKVTQINMYFFGENKQQKSAEEKDTMNIHLFFDTQNLGKVQANVRLEKNTLEFSMYSSNPEDLKLIESFGHKIKELLARTDYQVNKINYGYFEAKSPIQEGIKEPTKVTSKKRSDSKFETTV